MHPVIMRQLAADHIRARYAKAEDERLNRQARRARRRAPSARPRPRPAGRSVTTTPAWTQASGRRMHEQPSRSSAAIRSGQPLRRRLAEMRLRFRLS